jgi:lysophospholipase L1-like esterase
VRAPDIRICFLGDSFTAGVGDAAALGWVGRVVARARAAGHDVTGYNLGVRRETSLDVRRRLAGEATPRLRDGDASAVVVAVGVNDTTAVDGRPRVGVPESLDALCAMVDEARRAGWPVLVVGPALVGDEAQNARIRSLSQAMADECRELAVPYVDVAGPLTGDARWLAEVRAGDGAHPAATGYDRLAELVWPAFAEWLATLPAQ